MVVEIAQEVMCYPGVHQVAYIYTYSDKGLFVGIVLGILISIIFMILYAIYMHKRKKGDPLAPLQLGIVIGESPP